MEPSDLHLACLAPEHDSAGVEVLLARGHTLEHFARSLVEQEPAGRIVDLGEVKAPEAGFGSARPAEYACQHIVVSTATQDVVMAFIAEHPQAAAGLHAAFAVRRRGLDTDPDYVLDFSRTSLRDH